MGSMPRLVALLTSVPALATTFSLTLERGDRQEAAAVGHLRIGVGSGEELRTARQESAAGVAWDERRAPRATSR